MTATKVDDRFLTDPRRRCMQVGLELFYSTDSGDQEAAKSVCEDCPLKDPCLKYAVAMGEEFGVWAGVLFSSRAERAAARQQVNGNTGSAVDAELAEDIRRLWEMDKSNSAIAKELDVTAKTVGNYLADMGLPSQRRARGKHLAIARLTAEHKPAREIAEMVGCTPRTVCRIRRQLKEAEAA